jgi:hypothetical protein
MASNPKIDKDTQITNDAIINLSAVSSSAQHDSINAPQSIDRRSEQSTSIDGIRNEQPARNTESGESSSLLVKDKDSSDHPRPVPVKQCIAKEQQKVPFIQYVLRDTWFYELVAMCISVSCLIAIGAVLKAYDGRVSPQLQYGLTLNAIISILATSTKAGLVYVVASSISQLKWCWVQHRERPLEHLQTYDDASRGFSGAFTMLFDRSGRSIAAIGASITILAVAFDPFVQQLLAYPIRSTPRPSSTVYTKRATLFNANGTSREYLYAVEAGIWSDSSQFARNPTCPSSNCTWPSFRSVGWCTKCTDVTSSATISGCTFTLEKDFTLSIPSNDTPINSFYPTAKSVPCKISLDQGAPVDFPMWAYVLSDRNNSLAASVNIYPPVEVVWLAGGSYAAVSSEQSSYYNQTFQDIDNPAMVFAHASLALKEADNPETGLTVTHVDQCVLSLCERTYGVSVVDGIAATSVQSTNWGAFEKLELDLAGPHLPTVSGTFQPEQLYWLPNPDDARKASLAINNLNGADDPQTSASIIDSEWSAVVTSQITSNATDAWSWVRGTGGPKWINYKQPPNYTNNNYSSDVLLSISHAGLGSTVNSIAASLTQLGLANSNLTTFGTVGISEIYVDVRWIWFLLPCLLELTTIGFFICTILISKGGNVHVWKSSLHAVLYHGLEKQLLDKQPIADTVSGMEQAAKAVKIRLMMSDREIRLALRSQQ